MLEVNAIWFVLLLEGFALVLLVLVTWAFFSLRKAKRKHRDVCDLAARIQQRAIERGEQTEAFLQAVCHLEGDELQSAVSRINRAEVEFFRQLVDCLDQGKSKQLATLDQALDGLIDSYKCLQPRSDSDPLVLEADSLRGQNEHLREDLSVARNQISHMINEFGDMFGGGAASQLTVDEVLQRLAENRDQRSREHTPPAADNDEAPLAEAANQKL